MEGLIIFLTIVVAFTAWAIVTINGLKRRNLLLEIKANDIAKKISDASDPYIGHQLRAFQDLVYYNNVAAGWHSDMNGVLRSQEQQDELFPTRIALCHSELSEALEGFRRDWNDDHLPNRKMAEVELADTVIRVFDLGGAMGYDLSGAIFEKLEYNKKREDHKLQNRKQQNGKKF